MIDVLLAVPDLPQEPDLVVAAASAGLRVRRRCVDAVDLFAAAAAESGPSIILSAGLPRLGRDVVDRLSAPNRVLLGLAAEASDGQRLRDLGVTHVVRVGPGAEATLRACAAAIHAARGATPTGPLDGVWTTGCWDEEGAAAGGPPASDRGSSEGAASEAGSSGRVVAVWGPMGAPGRTTVAIGLAEALADSGHRTCLVDADTYAPSITMALGVVDDAGGLVTACRLADSGNLTAERLRTVAGRVRGELYLLGGVGQPERWRDLRPAALDRVWLACRSAFDVTVVDAGFSVEDAEAGEGPGSAWRQPRNSAALSLLETADQVVAVADSTALGAARLAAAWPGVAARAPGATLVLVQNRAGGRVRERRRGWDEAVREAGVGARPHRVPEDRKALAAAWSNGRTLAEGARRSPVRRSLVTLASAVMSG